MYAQFQSVNIEPTYLFTQNEIEWILSHLHLNINESLLSKKYSVREKELLIQIALRQKIKNKLPTWYAHTELYMPPMLNMAQASSEATAKFKATLMHGKNYIDLTLGMGIDSYYMAKNFDTAYGIELDNNMATITAHNYSIMGLNNFSIAKGIRAEDFLQEIKTTFDWIYIDPSRRDDNKKKVFFPQDCKPNINNILNDLLLQGAQTLIKLSPLTDIPYLLNTWQHINNIYVIEYQNECKELLVHINKNNHKEAEIKAIILDKEITMAYTPSIQNALSINYSEPLQYIYEPSAAIIKSGAFGILSCLYPIMPLAAQTHLFTSHTFVPNFPGRIFLLQKIIKPKKKEILQAINDNKAHVTIRNFPDTVAAIRKKWNLKEGGENYLFVTTLNNKKKVVLYCKKAYTSF